MNWKALTKTAKRTLSRNSSKILLGLGIAGAFTAVGFAITATPKAMILLEEKKQELGVEKLDAKTIVKTAAPVYIPTAISMGVSTGCIQQRRRINLTVLCAALGDKYGQSSESIDRAMRRALDFVIYRSGQAPNPRMSEVMGYDCYSSVSLRSFLYAAAGWLLKHEGEIEI